MTNINDWIWNEIQQIGKDYESIDEVAVYDESHSKFRDIKKEGQEILTLLEAKEGATLLDIGCGTGVFVREAFKAGLSVTAVDVSERMLQYAEEKAILEQCNIKFLKGGFLSLDLELQSFDFVTTSFSFHHLPDFYKFVALKRINSLLNDDGILFIQDIVIAEEDYEANINTLINRQEDLGGDFLREDAIQHFQEEFSTFDWILDQMIQRSGFEILNKTIDGGLLARYRCQKSADKSVQSSANASAD
ncbi:MAG: class I SAM-dependent methyltransferase [Gammaproteobacteria bacterium]|nr:class I SAM-dependent methyltransferase [Gammaproteobacteria bacterium]